MKNDFQRYFRSMIRSRKFLRLKNDEQLPVVVLAILILCVIHFCNKHDEETANQYVLIEQHSNDRRICSLYPSTIKGFVYFYFEANFSKCLR